MKKNKNLMSDLLNCFGFFFIKVNYERIGEIRIPFSPQVFFMI